MLLFAGAPFKLCDGDFIASDTKRPQQHWSNVDALSGARNGNVIKYNDEGVACQQGANIGANKGACDGATLTNIDGDKFRLGSNMHITLMLTIIVLLTMEVQFLVIEAKLALTISCQYGNSKLM